MLALPCAKILHGFKCLCAVPHSRILVRKSWLFAALLWLCSGHQGVHAGSNAGTGAGAEGRGCTGHRSVVWSCCFEREVTPTACL